MDPLTPQQNQMLQTWAEKRDSLVSAIGVEQTELDSIRENAKIEGLNLAELHTQIAESKGRLMEILALEERHANSVSTDVVALEKRKSRLESECEAQEGRLASSIITHGIVLETTKSLESSHGMIKDHIRTVSSIVGQIVDTGIITKATFNSMLTETKTVTDYVIEKGNANVAQTSIVLEKLPKYIFELQRPIPVLRTYAVPANTAIRPT